MRSQLLTLAALAAGASAQMMNLTALLGSTPQLSNLTTFVSLFPALVEQLGAASNITILAPSNDAFAKFLNTSMISTNDTDLIRGVLEYHVLNGTYDASAVMSTPAFIPTLLDDMMFENVTGGQVVEAVKMDNKVMFFSGLLMNSTVTKADLNFTGGVVHIIDTLLTVPMNISSTAVAAGLSSAAGALMNASLVEALDTASDVTVFVPNNAAFQAIGSALPNLTTEQLTAILEYHVVNGTVGYSSDLMNGTMLTTMSGMNVTVTIENGTVFVNSAKVIIPDVLVANGVVHVIDNVLNPMNTTATPMASATSGMPAFSGASSASMAPFTSGIPTPTMTVGGGAGSGAGGAAASGNGGAATASGSGSAASTSGAAVPARTGAMGAAALFGGAAVIYNL